MANPYRDTPEHAVASSPQIWKDCLWKCLAVALLGSVGIWSAVNTGHTIFAQSYGQSAQTNVTLLIVNLMGLLVFSSGMIFLTRSAIWGLAISLAGCLFGMAGGLIIAQHHLSSAYAQRTAASIVIKYMGDHQNDWPKTWSDLQPYFVDQPHQIYEWEFDRFQEIVVIDFSAETKELQQLARTTNDVPFHVISGQSSWSWQLGDGPNATIASYLSGSTTVD